MRKILVMASMMAFVAILGACGGEKLEPVCDGSTPTYDGEIKKIIDNNCMGSTCHHSGSKRGDWTTYELLKPVLDDGTFRNEVLVDQSMPRFGSLDQSDINLIQCWYENGFPEK